jgi:hypothetical protein
MFYTKTSVDTIAASLKIQLNTVGDQLIEMRNELNLLQQSIPTQIAEAIEGHELAKVAKELKIADDRQKSDTPFVEIISDGYDPELGVQLQLDWNTAFIKELKSKGYNGSSERDIVNKWLMAVHKQLAADFEKADRV